MGSLSRGRRRSDSLISSGGSALICCVASVLHLHAPVLSARGVCVCVRERSMGATCTSPPFFTAGAARFVLVRRVCGVIAHLKAFTATETCLHRLSVRSFHTHPFKSLSLPVASSLPKLAGEKKKNELNRKTVFLACWDSDTGRSAVSRRVSLTFDWD